ncbi:restriction endonuclease [Marinococcus luteus]|uniref:restriction endonuclease n=1 Tax=Marinococcus luteus TaxID=1122204 RepID=UPI002ACC668E|nr:restriction endonuclease [Marinococcus luteus]MDZ5781882.1 restriction endonuclease [Marinococcus luteus]
MRQIRRLLIKIFRFEELSEAPLIIDAIYEGGRHGNTKDEPLPKLIPGLSNSGGFRKSKKANSEDCAFVALYTIGNETEWPDFFDTVTGHFRYYGDNREPGNELHHTPKGGNKLLKHIFGLAYASKEEREKLPAILVFQKQITENSSRSVRFIGLAVPGHPQINSDETLVAIWRTKNGERFQNYEAYFTIIDTGTESISKKWLADLKLNNADNKKFAPKAWIDFVENGISSIKPLKAPKINKIRNKTDQIPFKENDLNILNKIYEYYKEFPYNFEKFAVTLVQLMDSNFIEFDITRPWRDGGRDAIGKYRIGHANEELIVDCALEAKLFHPDTAVVIKHTSRLISRLRHRQFGIFVTTSYISKQAYEEIQDDKHPILIISGIDIVTILVSNHINTHNIENYLATI